MPRVCNHRILLKESNRRNAVRQPEVSELGSYVTIHCRAALNLKAAEKTSYKQALGSKVWRLRGPSVARPATVF